MVAKNRKTPVRVQALAWRLLERHAEFSQGFAEVLITKARGYDKLAMEKLDDFIASFARHNYELERWMDMGMFTRATKAIVKKKPMIEY